MQQFNEPLLAAGPDMKIGEFRRLDQSPGLKRRNQQQHFQQQHQHMGHNSHNYYDAAPPYSRSQPGVDHHHNTYQRQLPPGSRANYLSDMSCGYSALPQRGASPGGW